MSFTLLFLAQTLLKNSAGKELCRTGIGLTTGKANADMMSAIVLA